MFFKFEYCLAPFSLPFQITQMYLLLVLIKKRNYKINYLPLSMFFKSMSHLAPLFPPISYHPDVIIAGIKKNYKFIFLKVL